MEDALAKDFRFSSPQDDRIDRNAYFERCWPNAGRIQSFDFEDVAESGDHVFVRYEAIGFVIDGRAELEIEGQKILLQRGDSWLVPKGAEHCYRIREEFTAVEATAPPAEVHARDETKF